MLIEAGPDIDIVLGVQDLGQDPDRNHAVVPEHVPAEVDRDRNHAVAPEHAPVIGTVEVVPNPSLAVYQKPKPSWSQPDGQNRRLGHDLDPKVLPGQRNKNVMVVGEWGAAAVAVTEHPKNYFYNPRN